jgi:hypothetical protein
MAVTCIFWHRISFQNDFQYESSMNKSCLAIDGHQRMFSGCLLEQCGSVTVMPSKFAPRSPQLHKSQPLHALLEWKDCRIYNGRCVREHYLVASGTTFKRGLLASFRIRIRYCVIFVSLCLFLCTRNLGQYAICSSICTIAIPSISTLKQQNCKRGCWLYTRHSTVHSLLICAHIDGQLRSTARFYVSV